jgi:hypothetical protein
MQQRQIIVDVVEVEAFSHLMIRMFALLLKHLVTSELVCRRWPNGFQEVNC